MILFSITFKAKHFFAFIKIKENKNFSHENRGGLAGGG